MERYPEFTTGLLILAFACGILIAEYLGLLSAIILCVLLALCSVWIIGARVILLVIAIASVLGCVRFVTYTRIASNDISALAGKTVGFSGWISQEPEMKDGVLRFVLKCRNAEINGRWVPVEGNTAVYVHNEALSSMKDCQYGDWLIIKDDIYIPSNATNPGQFSFQRYLSRQGIYSACSVWKTRDIRRLRHGIGNPFFSLGIIIRRYMISGIEKVFAKREASVVAGMVLGTYAYLPEDIYDAFTRTGTLHLLAASGFNCFVLIVFLAPLLKLKKMKPTNRHLIMAFLVLIYLLVVGMKPSMERAAVMASLSLLALPFRRIPRHSNLLFSAGLLILIIRPTELFDVGFQLSFSAVGALVLLMPEIERCFPRYSLIHDYLRESTGWLRKHLAYVAMRALETVAATLVIAIVTGPIIAYYFNYVSTTSLLCNLVMSGTVMVIFGAGVIAGLFSFIPLVAASAGVVGTLFTRLSLDVIVFFGEKEWSVVPVASPNPACIALYYIVLGLGISLLRSNHAKK